MINNHLAPRVSKARDMGAHTECEALDVHQQTTCQDFTKASRGKACMHIRFGFMCTYNNYKPIDNMVGGTAND